MAERLILPPNYPNIDGPVIFLAGPIQGAPMWQEIAVNYIHSRAPELWVASPRRGREKLGSKFDYEEQVDWETVHLRKAAQEGIVMFWLAKEETHQCDRAYAQTSRFELAEWKTRHERDGTKLVIGIEPGFTNERYIRRRFSQDCPDICIQNALDVTCDRAIEEVNK